MSLYTIITIIVSLAALFAYINHKFIRLPSTIGIMVLSLISSLILVFVGRWLPGVFSSFTNMVAKLDFYDLLINMMLSFLLFAGAIHINAERLNNERAPIIALASVGTILSTFIIGGLLYLLFQSIGHPIDIIDSLLFGALISPTDPIAVLGMLKKVGIPKSLEMKIAGESLFNDGVGVVIFLTLLEVSKLGIGNVSGWDIVLLFLKEAGGGLLYGAILGYIGFQLLRSVDNYQIEILITLAIVMGGYTFANWLHVSGPLAMVIAGIITGNKSRNSGLSEISIDYLNKFWELVDEILNAVLFLLIGFEMLLLPMNHFIFTIGLIAIVLVLFARWISVAVSVLLLKKIITLERHAITILTWGGLRGGLSVALALALPANSFRSEFISLTYIIVVFSIVVQGLTVGKIAKKIY